MSTDYAAKEREFLDALEDDTGRDLASWMAAIDAANLTHRNEIIDWLRAQGFMFSKASWLERIHNNSGKPIYLGAPDAPAPSPRRARAPTQSDGTKAPEAKEVAAPSANASAPQGQEEPVAAAAQSADERASAPSSSPASPADLETLLAKAKAFRPLASYVLSAIAEAVPGVQAVPEAAHVSLRRPQEFAVLVVGPRELRLGLALGTRPAEAPLQPARFTNAPSRISPRITHMVVLTDARQIDPALLALVREAAAGA